MSNHFTSKKIIFINNIIHKKKWRRLFLGIFPLVIRGRIIYRLNRWQKKKTSAICDKILVRYFSDYYRIPRLKHKKKIEDRKIIWQYWDQGINEELPIVVKLCFDSVDKYKGDYEVIRLDKNSLHDYVDIPDFILKKRNDQKIKIAFFTDIVRLALLDLYGGVWLDATIFLSGPIDSNILNQDFFMFQRSKNANNKEFWINFNHDYFGWDDGHYVNILNSFIVANVNNTIIHNIFEVLIIFWELEDNIPHYFLFQIMLNQLFESHTELNKGIIIDDTFPHMLITILNKDLDVDFLNDIFSRCSIHKLTYIDDFPINSVYSYLFNRKE